MKRPFRIGLVGAGRWGRRYIATVAQVEALDLVGVASRNPETAALLPDGCRQVGDWRKLVDDFELDGLVVATPPHSHYEITRACIEAGIAALVEKPFTLDPAEARELERLALARGALVMVNHTHLFASAYAALKKRLQVFNRPLQIRAIGGNNGPFREDVDALWDYGPHDLSMCFDLVGEELVDFEARSTAASGAGMVVEAELEFVDGSRADIRVGNGMDEKKRWLSVSDGEQNLVYDDLAVDKLWLEDGRGGAQAVEHSPLLPLDRSLMAFRDAIATGPGERENLALGVRVVEMLERMTAMIAARDAGARMAGL